MFITRHAYERIEDRLSSDEAATVIERLEAVPGEEGTVAYIALRLDGVMVCEDGSNGDLVVAISVHGTVETIMLRRSFNQTFNAAHFGASRTVDLDRGGMVAA